MFRFFLLFILLYVLFKVVKFFFGALTGSSKVPPAGRPKQSESKYKDVEEAKFIEIKEDKQTEKEQTGSNGSK